VPLLVVVIQEALLEAVQAQQAPAVTVTLPLPPVEVNEPVLGEIVYVHGAASWVTVKVWPPIDKVPERDVVLGLAAIE